MASRRRCISFSASVRSINKNPFPPSGRGWFGSADLAPLHDGAQTRGPWLTCSSRTKSSKPGRRDSLAGESKGEGSACQRSRRGRPREHGSQPEADSSTDGGEGHEQKG